MVRSYVTNCNGVVKVSVFIWFSVRSSQTKKLEFVVGFALGLCDRRYADAEAGVLLDDTATVDIPDKVSLKLTVISNTHCCFFTRVLSPRVVLASDWLQTFSNIFSDLLQHFCHIDTFDTKMLILIGCYFRSQHFGVDMGTLLHPPYYLHSYYIAIHHCSQKSSGQ